jgi:hypothetical protein
MKNLIGNKYGMLTVLSRSLLKPDLLDSDLNSLWDCQCDCGNRRIIKRNRLRSSSMRQGSVLSCGCANKQKGLKLRKDPKLGSAKNVWSCKYSDGCSFEKFLELSQQKCFWCGALPKNKSVGTTTKSPNTHLSEEWQKIKLDNPFIYNGLDRLDSSKDHSEDNIVPCCAECNRAKMDRTVEDFLSWIKRIYDYQFNNKNE